MTKKRILLCGEYSGLNSGYANWSRNLLEGLHSSNKYELAEFACFCSINDLKSVKTKWKIYPNSVIPSDERYKTYKSNPNNTFGQWRFDAVCLDFKPDIVIDFRDPWMFDYQSFSPLRRYFKWIIMPPVDSIPQRNEWITIFSNADLVIPYTNWAKDYLSYFKNLKLFNKISPAGVDHDTFKSKKVSKEEFGLPKDSFVIGAVMRNQKRKLIPALFEMISKLDNCILYLHTTYPELNGWNIPSLLLQFNVMNKVYFTYKCRLCKKHYCSHYSGINTVCKYCSKPSSMFATTSSGITDEQLSEIYNTFDIYVQYAVCEGFGMPQIEASSCGIPVFSVDYSAMSEVVRNIDGFPLPLANLQYEMESHAKRAYPDIDKTIDLINEYRNLSDDDKNTIKHNTRTKTIEYYSWNNIVKVWEDAIDSIDLSTSKDWNSTDKYELPDNIRLDYSLSNFDFINDICCNIIKEPGLMKTQMIQHTLHSLDHGTSKNGSNIEQYTKRHAAENLERFARQKAMIEHIRTTPGKINEDYIK
jgi:glycosyltransferase involved in cell wall biosynthesis